MVVVDDLHDVSPVCSCTESRLTSPPTSSAQAEVNNFLKHWKEDIQPKLVALLSALSKTPLATAILSCQIFSYRPVLEKNVQFLQAEEACLLAGGLEEFHRHCHVDGIALDAIGGGPMGKVWENGDVQVVQYPSSLPISAYPMDRFPREALPLLGEVVFLPVYDGVVNSPTPGIVGVVECMLNRQVTTDMVVAKVITVLGAVMKDVRLSLYPPSKAIEKDQSRLQEVSFVRNLSSMQRMASQARLNEFMD